MRSRSFHVVAFLTLPPMGDGSLKVNISWLKS